MKERDVAIKAVVFDIGGILETIPEGGDPTRRFPEMIAQWEQTLGMAPGSLETQIVAMDKALKAAGKDADIGTCSEVEWVAALRETTGWDEAQADGFMCDFWDIYCGEPNTELTAYFRGLRPRYQTAFLSNSFDGARREEERRLRLSELAETIIYSHEVGVAKPNRRIYALTCERLGVQPGEMVFLDDGLRNVAAARDYGIRAVLYQDNAQAIREIKALLAAHAD
jgi:epoxide hydrolase-like predicted phosphatase